MSKSDDKDIIRENLKSSFDVVFSWRAGEKGTFKSEDIVYHDNSNAANWKSEAYKFWQNTQFVIYQTFKYEASFITMVYGELLHNCVLHVEASKGRKESIIVKKLETGSGEDSETDSGEDSFLIQFVVKDADIFDDSSLFRTPPQTRKEDQVKLFDLVSFGYETAKLSALQLNERTIKAIKRLSKSLARALASFLKIDESKVSVIEEISLMLVSYGFPSSTFCEKCFSLYNQKGHSAGGKNYSSSGKFVIWNGPVIATMVDKPEYKLWVKTLKLEAYSRTIKNLLDLSRYQAIRSAIGSIMSRNGSHNIGSHVLAALSHNVGTMPDDRVLYQYIQHRMDYIATATTDRPTWSQPTMFVGTMIKHFLTQRHLLNYISRSEGLKAWEFQSDRAKSERGGRIKLHVRKVDGKGNLIHDFIKYDSLTDPIDLSHDVTLAIPGGVVGQHAFFTIIENVIRNAAKHDWSTPPKSTAILKELPPKSEKSPSTGDLDVYIDFEDNPEMKDVHFTIWSRLSDVFDNVRGAKSQEKSLSPREIRRILKANDDVEKLPLHRHQQIELAKSFITGMGDLRRENWGLAEMKISAGYLQKAKIEDIGGISDSDARYRIIVPCCVDDSQANDARFKLNVKHLGYKFNIPKARQILFVVSRKPRSLKLNPDIETGLRKNGIYVKTKEEIASDTTCNYAYVVMDTFPEDKEIRQMPFRIIAMSMPEACDTNDKKQDSDKSCDTESEDICPVLNKAVSCAVFLEEVIAHSNNDTQQITKELIEAVCECWVRYLRNMRKLSASMPVYINTVGGKHGSGKSLVTDLDIVEYAFNEGIDGALNAFLKIGKNADAARYLVDCLKSLKSEDDNLLIFDRERELALIKELKDTKDVRVQFSREAIIKRQLSAWLVEWRKTNDSEEVDNAINYLNGLSKKLSDIENNIDKLRKSRSSYSQDSYDEKLEDLLTQKLEAERSLKSPIAFLVDFLHSYCEQVSGLMSKYAETIATLPECFSKGEREKPWDEEWVGLHFWKDKVPEQEADSTSKFEPASQIRYWRHETERKAGANGEGIDIYLEGLSGSQSYLNILERFSKDDRFMQTRLVENALLRMLIIDERTRDFLEKHPSMFAKFDALGISVANDQKLYVELEKLEKKRDVPISKEDFGGGEIEDGLVTLSPKVLYNMRKRYSGRSPSVSQEEAIAAVRRKFRDKYEVIVIHQGIIDKWLPGASHNKKMVADFLARLEKVFRYVVITTGRGTPANIPATARVLPFSTIQTSLFSQYPEKLLLSDAIMNIIPVKGASDDK